jgi:hypothetical protein
MPSILEERLLDNADANFVRLARTNPKLAKFNTTTKKWEGT